MGFLLFLVVVAALVYVYINATRKPAAPTQRPAPPRPVEPASFQPQSVARPQVEPYQAVPMPPKVQEGVPESLPVSTKKWFFSQSERALFLHLRQALEGTSYSIFPNVRLNDIFMIGKYSKNQRGTYARLRDKHVDFLIVEGLDFRPVLAIELDGESHDHATQQYRDEVKNTAFRSAGLTLVRLDARQHHSLEKIREGLRQYLPGLQPLPQSAD